MASLKEELNDVLDIVNWASVAKCIGKSNSWLYHKINGIDGNKKPCKITQSEKDEIANALDGIANRILVTASNLR